jgi:hypothetical protein
MKMPKYNEMQNQTLEQATSSTSKQAAVDGKIKCN